MTSLTVLKAISSLGGVAALLGYQKKSLAYLLYKKPPSSKYVKFSIPKKYGGIREIVAPSDDLKLCQRKLANLLEECIKELDEKYKRKNQIAHGFRPERSIVTNAQNHRGRRYVFNIDLKNFFPSINFGRVYGYFIKDKDFSLHPKVATILAQIACYEGRLPQGSPCSPVISHLIGNILDIHLVRLAEKQGCSYTRYADDLTFSTNQRTFPKQIAYVDSSNVHIWKPGNELTRLIKLGGFEINESKTRMQYRDSRQEVTGLVVNKKVNVRSDYRKTVRAMVHRLLNTGSFDITYKIGSTVVGTSPGNQAQLRGMLGFIDGIDLRNNENLQKLTGRTSKELTKKEIAYRRFLVYKEFYSTPQPVIICEGKTDNVYLLFAIRRLVDAHPALATKNADGSINLKVRIYKYAGKSTDRILQMRGGTPLAKFIVTYCESVKHFKVPASKQPVIMLIDNDQGAGSFVDAAKKFTKDPISTSSPFTHISRNLYLVPTPAQGGGSSTIEEFFDDATLNMKLGTKSFKAKVEGETDKYFGKAVFAEKIVRIKADTIDFSGFNQLLSNIEAVIAHHSAIPVPQ